MLVAFGFALLAAGLTVIGVAPCYGFVFPYASAMASILVEETSLLALVALHFHDRRWCIESCRLLAS